jgi:hypothetical protein
VSGLGGKKTQSTQDQRLNAIQVNQSAYGNAIPLVYGKTRVPMTLGWYGNFKATPHSAKQSGGKGGGGGGGNTTFTYSAALIGLLCEGIIHTIQTVWSDKEQTTTTALGLTIFNGVGTQPVWSYLTTNFPAQAIPYDHTAYVAIGNFDLGGSAGLPNLTFEVVGLLSYSFGSIDDALASDILIDYCIDANHGAGFNFLSSGLQGSGVTTWESYCIAMGFFFSPCESSQRAAVDFVNEMMQMTNSAPVWSAGQLNIIPFQDASVTGNGRTYTPDLTPLFAFGDDDYCPSDDEEPITVTRKPASETFNVVNVEFLDRANQYNTAIATAEDSQDVALNGRRVMSTVNLHGITDVAVARQVAQLILQRQLYIRNEYTFRVRADYSLLEPMDLVSITDTPLGILNKLVRITETDDDEEDFFTITAEEMLVGTASAPRYNWQGAQGFAANYGTAPGSVLTPLIFAMPPLLVDANGGYELAIAVAGSTGNWGGCDVFMSLDNSVYAYIGTIYGSARYGTLTATMAAGSDPDTSHALQIVLADPTQQLVAGNQADADNLRTLIWVDGEIMAYQYCTLTGAGAYTFTSNGNPSTGTKYMRRGRYGSANASHASGSSFARLDGALMRVPIDAGMIGQTAYFKFCSFNIYTGGHEDIASVTAYSKVLANANAGQNLPGQATLIARNDCVLVGDKIFKKGSTTGWDSDCYSLEALTAAAVSARASAGHFMFGLNSDPTTDQNYTSLDFAWEVDVPTGAALAWIQTGSQNPTLIASGLTSSDVLSVRYDGQWARWYRNGSLLKEWFEPGKVVFFDSSFYLPGSTALDVSFSALTGATPAPFIARGNCKVSDNNIIKQGGSAAWDSDCYSITGLPVCHCSFKANGVTGSDHWMAGLNTDPTTDQSYTSIDYAWYNDAGSLEIREGGSSVTTVGTLTAATFLAITNDGSNIRYYKDDVTTPVRTVAASGLTTFFDCSLYDPGTGLNSLRFGPTTNIAVADTGQIGNNAATDLYLVTAAGPISKGFSYADVVTPITGAVTKFACTAIFTATFDAVLHSGTGFGNAFIQCPQAASGPTNGPVYLAPTASTHAAMRWDCPLDAGVTPVFQLLAHGVDNTNTLDFTNVIFQVEIIKR